MSLRAGAAFVDLLPRVGRTFGSDVEKAVADPSEQAGKKAGGLLGGALGKAAAAAGGLFAAKQAFDFLGDAADAARESNKVSAQTEAVIRSTGGAAKLTAKQFGDLSTAISNKTGIDDEAIQSAENLLATFTNVRNEAGKGNDVFSQATEIMVDMGAAMGTEPKAAAIQLGKALNDPIKGITALSRVGVTFSEEQKTQIATMVEQGKTAEAQKVILAELRKEFGGSAAAQANASDRLKVTLGNLQETLGAKLLPILDKASTFLADKLPGALDAAGRGLGALGRFVAPLLPILSKVFLAFKVLTEDDGPQGFGEIMDNLLGNSGKWVGFFRSLGETILKVAGFVRDNLKPILVALGVTIALLTAPITTVVAALVLAYLRFDGFRKVVDAVVGFLVKTAAPAVARFAGMVGAVIGDAVDYVVRIWPQVSEAIGHVLAVVQGIIDVFVAVVGAVWRTWGDDLGRIVGAAFGFVKATIENVLRVVRGIIQFVLAVINGDWGKAWDALKSIVGAVFEQIKDTIAGAFGILEGLFGGIADTLGRAWSGLWDGIKAVARKAFEWIADHVLNPIIRAINRAIDGFNLLKPGDDVKHLSEIGVDPVSTGGAGGTAGLRVMHSGGIVPGRRGQEVPALLEAGELVTSARMADRLVAGGGAAGAALVVEHLEVKGQERPAATARETVRGLRKLAYLSGSAA